MARARRRGEGNGLDAWPGYVDALSTLLMVIMFVLLVFVLAQAFLSVALSGRDEALDKVNRQLAELSNMLALERGEARELRLSIAQLSQELQTVSAGRDDLSQRLAALGDAQARVVGERDALRLERDQLAARLADAGAIAKAQAERSEQLQAQLAEAAARADAAGQANTETLAQLADARRELAAAEARLVEMKKQAEALDKVVKVDRDTVNARLSELARLQEQVRALTALRDELEKKAQQAAAKAMSEAELRAAVAKQLEDERKLSESARARIALMTRQVEELRAQLAGVAHALEIAEQSGRDKDAQIANLGQRLNAALAAKVEELQRYRSDFFGKLRDVMAGRPGVRVVGDRFVFQSEVLFPVGSAELSPAGREQMAALARTLGEIVPRIPANVPWVLRVDGHADRTPLSGRGMYASNWELSAARAITVVKQLIADGIAARHLAATGFGDNQPIDGGDTPEAYAKNRRIELRLTDR